MSDRRTYTKTCKRCAGEYQSYRNIRKPGVCGRMECLTAEAAEHNAAVAAYDAMLAARRAARPRTPRQAPQYAATDWNMLVAFTRKGSQRRSA